MSFVGQAPGKVSWTQYAVVTTKPIKAGVDVAQGEVLTPDGDGYLIKLTAASGHVDNADNGFFQALAKSDAVSGEADGARTVQCMGYRSRITMLLAAGLIPGQEVEVAASGSTVDPDKAKARTGSGKRLGILFAVEGGKRESADDDKGDVEVF